MQGSINFDGSLVGNITGGGGGGGDTVVITPVVTSGTKIADVSVNGVEKDLYCPTPPTPQEVEITPIMTSGTKIADVSIDGDEKDLFAPNPTQVNVTQVQQSGTKIASINVNGVNTDIYAPERDGGDNYSDTEHIVGTWFNKTLYEKTVDVSFASINPIDNTFYYCGVDISQILPNITQGWIMSDMTYFTEPNEPNIIRKFIYSAVSSPTLIELWTAYSRTGTAKITFRYTKD